MAMKFETPSGDSAKRHEYFFVNPTDIISEGVARGRHYHPSEDDVLRLAASMMDHGQQNAIVCRKGPGDRLYIVSGFTRLAAAIKILEVDPEFRIKVTVSQVNEKEAACRNIVENAIRNETSAIDDAFNHRDLAEKHGMTPEEIVALYGYTDARKLQRLSRLLEIPERAQELIHIGQCPVSAALDILDLPTLEQQESAWAEVYAMAADGKVKGSAVRAVVREAMADNDSTGDSEPAEKPEKIKSRTMKELNEWLATHGPESGSADWMKVLAFSLGQWIKGTRQDRWLDGQIDKAFTQAQESEAAE